MTRGANVCFDMTQNCLHFWRNALNYLVQLLMGFLKSLYIKHLLKNKLKLKIHEIWFFKFTFFIVGRTLTHLEQLFIFIFFYIFIYIYIYLYIYLFIFIYIFTYIYVYIYLFIFIYIAMISACTSLCAEKNG